MTQRYSLSKWEMNPAQRLCQLLFKSLEQGVQMKSSWLSLSSQLLHPVPSTKPCSDEEPQPCSLWWLWKGFVTDAYEVASCQGWSRAGSTPVPQTGNVSFPAQGGTPRHPPCCSAPWVSPKEIYLTLPSLLMVTNTLHSLWRGGTLWPCPALSHPVKHVWRSVFSKQGRS